MVLAFSPRDSFRYLTIPNWSWISRLVNAFELSTDFVSVRRKGWWFFSLRPRHNLREVPSSLRPFKTVHRLHREI